MDSARVDSVFDTYAVTSVTSQKDQKKKECIMQNKSVKHSLLSSQLNGSHFFSDI